MGVFNTLFGGGADINALIDEARHTQAAIIVDVREPDEFAAGHVPDALNVALSSLTQIKSKAPDLATPLYVYCLSGARSGRAVQEFSRLGYTNVKNAGGINRWAGAIEKGV